MNNMLKILYINELITKSRDNTNFGDRGRIVDNNATNYKNLMLSQFYLIAT